MDVKRLLAVMLVLVLSVMQISPAGAYTLTMPSSLVTVEESAFEGDTSLDAISFTEGFETIGPRAFAYSSVKDLSLPSTFIRLADEAFLGNQGLSDLYLPDGIQFIGTRAFAYSSLESIYLPPSLNLIADDAFEGIIDLAVYASYDTYAYEWGVTHGYITPSNTDLDYEFEAIDEYTTKVVAYHGNDLDILFPTSDPYGRVVTVIGERVFSSQEVHNIVIPSSVHTIEDYAFCDAIGLETIEIPNSVTEIGQDAISNAEVTCRLNSTAYEYAYRNALRVNLIGNYTITGLERENNTFSAVLSVTDPCNLFVRIFEDNDIDLIIEQVVSVPGNLYEEVFSFDIDVPLPEYFYVYAGLLDSYGDPISVPYSTIRYSSLFTEFDAKTPDNFKADDVIIDFGESGFGVMVEDTIVISDIAETLEEGQYKIPFNPELRVGDVVLVTDFYDTQIPVKIKTITYTSDAMMIITADDSITLSDVYQYLNLDTAIDVGDAAKKRGIADEANIRRARKVDFDSKKIDLVSLTLSLEVEHLKVSGTAQATVKVKSVFDINLFGADYYEWESYVETKTSAKVEVSGKIGSSDMKDAFGRSKSPTIPVYKGPIAIAAAGLIYSQLEITVPLEFSFKGTGTVELSTTSKTGFKYDTTNGYQEIKSKKNDTPKFEISGEFEIKFGPKIEFTVNVAGELLTGKLSAQAGLKANAKAKAEVKDKSGSSYHACDVCADITLAFFSGGNGSLSYKISKHIHGTIADLKLFSGEWTLGKYYYSIANEEDSLFRGKSHFGEGECPNKKYKVTIKTENEKGQLIEDVPILVSSDIMVYPGESTATVFLCKGSYKAAASFQNASRVEESFEVEKDAKTIIIKAKKATITGTIEDTFLEKTVSDATISFQQDSQTVESVLSDSKGEYSLMVAPGTYTVKVGAQGYKTRSFEYEVVGDRRLDIVLEGNYHSVSFYINGSEDLSTETVVVVADGRPLEFLPEATKKTGTFKGWNTSSDGSGMWYDADSVIYSDVTLYPIWSIYRTYNNHSYYICTSSYSWSGAEQWCEAQGGHLVTITSAGEQRFLESYMNEAAGDWDIWIGICADWKTWVTGEPLSYSNWGINEPDGWNGQAYGVICNGYRSGTNSCGYYEIHKGQWDDVYGSCYFICEWDYIK